MPRRTDAQLGKLVREAIKGQRLKPRRLYGDSLGDIIVRNRGGKPNKSEAWKNMLESDQDFVDNNLKAVVGLLEALAPSRRKKFGI